jgi:hypothetical protein
MAAEYVKQTRINSALHLRFLPVYCRQKVHMKTNRLVFVSLSLAMLSGNLSISAALAQHGTDVSLIPIAADEPVPRTGFPPLPNKLDLPQVAQQYQNRTGPQPKKVFGGGYVHEPLPTPSRDAFSPAPATYPNQQPMLEPAYQRANEVNSRQQVEAPQAVPIDQAHTQDLSFPNEADQNQSGGRSQSNFSRNKQQLENNFIRKPFMNLRSRLGIF